MKKKCSLKTYFAIPLCLLLQLVSAQSIASDSFKPIQNAKDSQWSIGPVTGFKMIKSLVIYDLGIQLSRSVSAGKRVRVEVSYRSAGSNLAQNWGSIPMNMKTDIGSVLLGAGYDWFPFIRRSEDGKFLKSLKVIGGAWYINKPEYNFNVSLQDPLVWGALTFTPEEIGAVATSIKTNKLQPFLGLGYEPLYLIKNINLSIHGGFLYQGKPNVTMVATNMLKPTEESAVRLEHNLASYQFSPFVQMLVQFNL
jgi:hypothetical protein